MWFVEEPSQFPVGQTEHSLTCSLMEKPHTGLDDCLKMLLPCFRSRLLCMCCFFSVVKNCTEKRLIMGCVHKIRGSLTHFFWTTEYRVWMQNVAQEMERQPVTPVIQYCDYHLVTNIGYCDFSPIPNSKWSACRACSACSAYCLVTTIALWPLSRGSHNIWQPVY